MSVITIKCFVLSKQNVKLMSHVIRKLTTTMEKPSYIQWTLSPKNIKDRNKFFPEKLHLQLNKKFNTIKGIQENISALQMKKRPLRKKRIVSEDDEAPLPGFWSVKALATAEEYDLEQLMDGLLQQNLYLPTEIRTSAKRKYKYYLKRNLLQLNYHSTYYDC